MLTRKGLLAPAFAFVAASAVMAAPAHAGQMVIGFGPGGGYDLWGRTVARHFEKHVPGKITYVPTNMPGAGSYNAANFIYNVAPKDGTVIGIIARDAALGPLTGASGARFDATKLSWLGTPTTETNVCIANANADVKTVQDLYSKQLIVGDTGVGTGTHSYPKALAAILDMKFKIIGGFPSSSDVFLAMERGEVDGICESLDSVTGKRPEWIPQKKINLIFQGGAEKNMHIADVPYILDLAKTPEQKEAISFLYAGQGIGRPFIAPPDLQPGKLDMLRKAFDETMKDPDFKADAEKQKLDVDPEDGPHLEALIKKIYAMPKPIVEQVGKLIQ
ncbi:MAG: Bug family tripartite tricarboxylate transporter substrate binding protein [Gemmatimonas sp.]